MSDRTPAEVWHPGVFLAEEMRARGWSAEDVAREMGGQTQKELIVDGLTVMAICGDVVLPDDFENEIGPETAAKLARAFGTSAKYWENLDKQWHRGRQTPGVVCHRYGDGGTP